LPIARVFSVRSRGAQPERPSLDLDAAVEISARQRQERVIDGGTDPGFALVELRIIGPLALAVSGGRDVLSAPRAKTGVPIGSPPPVNHVFDEVLISDAV
jgi:hypothetical protein